MKVRTVSSFTDWTDQGGCWGRVGVRRIMEYLKVAGIEHVYWRVFDGGVAIYPSRIAQVHDRRVFEEGQRTNNFPGATTMMDHLVDMDFHRYNPLPDALEFGREYGINVHFWYTIFEDDHGGYVLSDFARQRQHLWQMDRQGRQYRGTLDWYYDEVRRYKLAIVDELLAYRPAGLLLDFVRHNACPSADRNGIHRFGYNPEIRAAYKKQFGVDPIDLPPDDPQWLGWKRATMTDTIRQIRRRIDASDAGKDLSLMLWPVDYATWACIDVPQLTAENAIQLVAGFSLKYSFHPREAADQLRAYRAQTRSDKVKILPGVCCDNGNYPGHVLDYIRAAEEVGADEVMLHEADRLHNLNLACTIRSINRGVPNYRRALRATNVAGDIDWSLIPRYSGFLFNSGREQRDTPSEQTSVQVAYNDTDVIFRFDCSDSHMDVVMSPDVERPESQYYLDVLGGHTAAFYQNTFNVFLDSKHCHQDYFHFAISPKGQRLQETFVDQNWKGDWRSEVQVRKDGWSGIIRIPYQSMGVPPPRPGDRWGLNLIRGIRANEETSIWYYIIWSLPYPDDMGHLEFLA